MLAVIAILSIVLGTASLYFKPMESALNSSAVLTQGLLRQARSAAMATTSAVRVGPSSDSELMAETADSCSATTWSVDGDIAVELPTGVTFTDTSWNVCFSPRGMSEDNVKIGLYHGDFGKLGIEVLLGGTTRRIQ
ncbi:MAG: hypothetical protein GY716_12345 [bacterium]|nr:hypothetical protein [bacterium]